ncbi:bifunctional 2-keto-4-hydroxyglutarate aldolase/2-keto-3-deoxy-6-phosphogluconate aldolase [Pseudobacteroides cellulosolvens]|uniref:2-dehydro-3-deoxyphosphogluconate aldolase/4-hydroxy-2-oxoglutarate aldolase n=1 Tax=Pseudobacteroides cellulosolvens ATCC 35603 = DSM 2933 TaxID=398512 RepID=A0A0L6JIR1_9FIRM|nr:bifunctional 2-keto-4-hydroxyglutarate aldolase/2-keto-3-deoxy-6-phosphogluconate aldolase [Pseudobacteroides cellulosolvens]KNY25625.1 2-dehydro-3-deoxyphosphogluconate aldolase/4-hydroxy-2-oxoglutarate aldolase [Pseudobacteroides cellulosolvens ATCC 35603 = DSM 2933]
MFRDKLEALDMIKRNKIISIIRTDNFEKALKSAVAIIEGGIRVLEFSYTMSFAGELIKELTERYKNTDVLIGAGTVLDPETAKIAFSLGSQFIISPCLNIETAKMCLRYQIPYIPGAMTVKETVECIEAGADIVKIFPSELFGPSIIRAIKGPLPQASLMPTGGVNVDNIHTWFEAGSIAVGIGKNLYAAADYDDYESVTSLAKSYVNKITCI